MSQLSRPYQIALAGALVFGLLWLVALRPSDGAEPGGAPLPAAGATAPGVQGLGSAIDKAGGAVATSTTAADATSAAADAASGDPTQPPAAAPAAPVAPAAPATAAPEATPVPVQEEKKDDADPSRPIIDAVASGKVAVVLFYEGKAADDRAVRRALRSVSRRGGKVRVYSAPIKNVGRYEAITRGVQVLSAPTVLVIGRDRAAKKIVGYTQTREIDQLVSDAITRARAASATGTPETPGSA